MLGKVSNFVKGFVQRRIDEHGIVVWYDPERYYEALLKEDWGEVCILRFEGSFLKVRWEVDRLWERDASSEQISEQLPRVLIYLPCRREETAHALVELETAGVCLAPGLQPDPRTNLARDTSLTVLAQEALRDEFPVAELNRLSGEIEQGRLSLEDLDKLVRPPEISPSLSALFGSRSPEELLLQFLTEPERDKQIVSRNLLESWRDFLQQQLDLRNPPQPLKQLRAFVIAHLLVTEAAVVSETADQRLWQGLPVVESPTARALAVKVVQRWRNDRNLEESYRTWATQVAGELTLPLKALPTEKLVQVETFKQADDILFERLVGELVEHHKDSEERARIQSWVERRLRGFWAAQDPEVASRWKTLLTAVDFFGVWVEVQREISKGRRWSVEELIARYGDRKDGWCRLDRSYLRFERARETLLDLPVHENFSKLISTVHREYRETVHRMALRLEEALARQEIDQHAGVRLQRTTFQQHIRPLLQAGARVAYILVDAFRYDLLLEFLENEQNNEASIIEQEALTLALGTLPAITPLGMAALLPGAESSLGVRGDRGNLVVEVDGQALQSLEERVQFLLRHLNGCGRKAQHISLKDLCNVNDRELKRLRELELLLVTSQEIDQAAENIDHQEALKVFLSVLRQLGRALRRLKEAGFEQVILATDHGFLLFGDELEEGEKIPPPTGQTIKLGRRYWIGQNAIAGDAYSLYEAPSLGLTGGLQFAFPHGIGVFRAPGGNTAYYHGGISPQELFVPILHLHLRKGASSQRSALVWRLIPATQTVTSRLLRLVIQAESQELFCPPRRVRLEIQASQEAVAFKVLNASCDYNSIMDIFTITPEEGGAYPPCKVMIELTQVPEASLLEVILIDADTGARLAGPVNLPIDVAIH